MNTVQKDNDDFSKWLILFLIFGFAFLWFAFLGYRHLVPSDEGRYAEMAREMWRSHDWITPRYNAYKYFEKPPLQTWANALTFSLFGLGEWQARLWTALTGFLGVLCVGYTGAKIFDRRSGLCAAMVLGAAPLWNALGHFNTLDMGLSLMMTVTLCALLLAQLPENSASKTRFWMLVCWGAMGLAVLSKGLVGIVLPGAVLIVYSLCTRDWKLWKRLHIIKGILLFLLIATPWFILVSMRNPEFFDFFFINEHFRRFLTKEHHRAGPIYYFIPVFLAGFLPWLSLFVQRINIRKFKVGRFNHVQNNAQTQAKNAQSTQQSISTVSWRNHFSPLCLLWAWAGFIFVFYSLSGSKLISYILPIFPALALLMGAYLSKLNAMQWKKHLNINGVILIVLLAIVQGYLSYEGQHASLYAEHYIQFKSWVYAGVAIALVGIGLAHYLNHRSVLQSICAYALGLFCMVSLIGSGHEVFGRQRSGIDLVPPVKAVLNQWGPETPFYSVTMLDHTLPYYLGHTMIMVQHPDELEFGIKQEPQKWIPTLNEFKKRWISSQKALALMSQPLYAQLKAQGLPMQVITQDAQRIVVKTMGKAGTRH